MSDIDEELLALAGDASSDEEAEAPVNMTQSASESPTGHASSINKGVTRKSTGKKSRARGHTESEEEGEASSRHSSPGSQKSAPMDESDSDSDNGPPMFDDGDRYPIEGKFMSATDKAEIMAMPEIKREEILAERSNEIERDRQNRALRQLLHAREAEKKKGDKKRKAGEADLDENQRKTSRQRTKVGGGRVGEASSGIDSLKRARDEKADRLRRRQEDLERNGGRRVSVHDDSDGDAGANSELEWDDGKPKKGESVSPPVHSPPSELVDIQSVCIGRTKFAKICFYPGFEEALIGGFVRVSVGTDDNRNNVYRMAQIKAFTEGRAYAMEKENGQTFVTKQYVRAAHGKAERDWPFITCSNSPFTEAEWKRYKQTCLVDNVKIPNRQALHNQTTHLYALENRSWTEAELTEKLRRSGALAQKYKSVDRNKLTKQLNQAKLLGDVERQEQIKSDLTALDGPKLAFGTSLHKKEPVQTGPKVLSQQDRLAIVNMENRRKNTEEVKAAQLQELREQRKIEAAIARGEDAVVDHSRRVRTRAVLKHDVRNAGGSGASTPAKTGTPKLSPKKDNTPLPHIAKLQAELEKQKQPGGIPTIRRPLCDDDIIGAIDFGIEIEL